LLTAAGQWLFASYVLVPLGMLELYFWAQRRAGTTRTAVATLLLVMTVLTAVGIYGAATIKWLAAMGV
jgi:hypothetical protein